MTGIPVDCPAGESTGASRAALPAATAAPPVPSRRAARAVVPGRPGSASSPVDAEPGGKTVLPAALPGADPRAGHPVPGLGGADPATASRLPVSPGRGRGPRTPAGASASAPPRAGSTYIRGGAALTATARCLRGCDWNTGPGTQADADRAAEKHTQGGHPTITCAEPGTGAA